jgi:glycosyltransferase involved in cell wall biosynthesis
MERLDGASVAWRPKRVIANSERLRVLRVIARMNVGGPSRQVVALSRGLDPNRFETRLLVGGVADGEADELDFRGVDLEHKRVPGLGRSPNPTHDARALVELIRQTREFRPHIVHTHTAKAGMLGRLAGMVADAALVHTFHGHLLRGYFSPAVTSMVREIERLLARRTHCLVAVGERVRDELLEARIGRPKQYVVVPPGVDVREMPERDEARRSLGLGASTPVVAFVGRLTGVKRPDRLAEVATRCPEATFLVCGDGESRPDFESRVRHLGDRVHLLGWRPDTETIYAASDVVVLTSDNEGMPVTLIEAAIAARPVVTTDVGSAAEVVVEGETGFVAPADAEAIASRVRQLLGDRELRHRMGIAASTRAKAAYSATRLVTDTERIYSELDQRLSLRARG